MDAILPESDDLANDPVRNPHGVPSFAELNRRAREADLHRNRKTASHNPSTAGAPSKRQPNAQLPAKYNPPEQRRDASEGEPPQPTPKLVPIGADDLTQEYSGLNEPIIEGLLRLRETMNVIASPKIGKSWLVLCLVLSVARGIPWLGFKTRKGKVLLIDNELHLETLAHRLRVVAEALAIDITELNDMVQVISLRAQLLDIFRLRVFLKSLKQGEYSLIVLDALYRLIPEGKEENSNSDMTQIYNAVDDFADHLQAAVVLVHHTSKGSQSGKSVSDVGSGAGSQSRAVDCHFILRPHEEPDLVVADANCRSWPPVAPVCLRWVWPLFQIDETADPKALRETGAWAKAEEANAKQGTEESRFLDALDTLTKQKGIPPTESAIRAVCSFSDDKVKAIAYRLRNKTIIEDVPTTVPCGPGGKKTRPADGIRRTRTDSVQVLSPGTPENTGIQYPDNIPIGDVVPGSIPCSDSPGEEKASPRKKRKRRGNAQ
jgi:AAA domain